MYECISHVFIEAYQPQNHGSFYASYKFTRLTDHCERLHGFRYISPPPPGQLIR